MPITRGDDGIKGRKRVNILVIERPYGEAAPGGRAGSCAFARRESVVSHPFDYAQGRLRRKTKMRRRFSAQIHPASRTSAQAAVSLSQIASSHASCSGFISTERRQVTYPAPLADSEQAAG